MRLTASELKAEKALRRQFPGLFNHLPAEKKKQIIAALKGTEGFREETQVVMQQVTSSPVPPAEMLAGYNAAFPDGANRLFSLVESQTAHRHLMEMKVIDSQIDRTRWGQIIAAVLSLAFGGIALLLALNGHPAVAGTVFSSTILALATLFVVGQKTQHRNLDQKAPKVEPAQTHRQLQR